MSVSKLARQRGLILDEIMRHQREQLPKTMRATPLADLRALASLAPAPADLAAALSGPGLALIAECKKASPSRGLLAPHYDPAGLAQAYVRGGASAVSVLTDGRHFQGSLEHLSQVKAAVSPPAALLPTPSAGRRQRAIPVLRKDFIFHPYQLYEARAAGADAVLLIAAVLEGGELAELLNLAAELGLAALLEVHTAGELERALALRPRIVGLNNRDLQTFQVDLETSIRLRPLVPAGVLAVAESGIRTAADVGRLAAAGLDAALVGESLLSSRDVAAATRALVEAGRLG
ncbi:MAG: indole-3-glycerol phosphate synthase TrpC [Candidatus Promineifilaceae bacterium]